MDSHSKTYFKPSELFDDACSMIAAELENEGFNFSKSQKTIKKKDKIFTYEIAFSSSHYNYIDRNGGYVVMEFGCFIYHKKQIIFSVKQKELRAEYHRFELFNSKTKGIDIGKIKEAQSFIKEHFLKLIEELNTDVNRFLEKVAKAPIARFEDYGFSFSKDIFTILNREDLIEKFEYNLADFRKKEVELNRLFFHKYIARHFNAINDFDTKELKELLINSWNNSELQNKALPNFYEHILDVFKRLTETRIRDRKKWLIDCYIVLNYLDDSISDTTIKKDVDETITKFLSKFKTYSIMDLKNVIEDLTKEGGNNNFVIIQLNKHYYIQMAGERGNTKILIETVSNRFLPQKYYLTSEQEALLTKLGWELGSVGNYEKIIDIGNIGQLDLLIDLIKQTANSVYGIKALKDEMLTVNFE